MSLKATTEILNRSRRLRTISTATDFHNRLQVAWTTAVPSNLRHNSLPVSVSEGNLLNVLVTSAAWATQVKLQQREILKKLNAILNRPLYRIKCHISHDAELLNPLSKSVEKVEAFPFSETHLKQIESLLQQADQPDFIKALQNLRDAIAKNMHDNQREIQDGDS